MGAGKSAVGALLAERLGRDFVDTDAMIERTAEASIAELFAREGEAAFRKYEREAIENLAGGDLVVAFGGRGDRTARGAGAASRKRNRCVPAGSARDPAASDR